jgi:hypothetical protein
LNGVSSIYVFELVVIINDNIGVDVFLNNSFTFKFEKYSPTKTLSLKQGHRGLGNTNLEGGQLNSKERKSKFLRAL